MADTLQDNAEQAPADLKLRESEQRFRTVFSQSPIAISLYDPDGRLIGANAACLDLFGAAGVEAIKGFRLLEYPHLPDDAERRLLAGQPVQYQCEFDFELVKQLGLYATTRSGRCHLECFINPWQPAALGRSGYLVHVLDITERKRAEEHVRESEERFRAIFESAQDPVFIKDRALRYIHVNPAMERLFGLSVPELAAKTDDELFGEEAGAGIRHTDTRVLAGETIEEEVTKPVRGVPTTFHIIKVPLRDDAGDVVGLCGIARDVTERVRAEEQIKASLREKEVLLREVHHRVKNNLQVISSLLFLQARAIKDDKALAAFQESRQRVQSMAGIHERLYQSGDLSQIEMEGYIRQLAADLRMTYGAHGIACRVDAAGVTLDMDTAIPCGLLLNELLSNALKHAFTPESKAAKPPDHEPDQKNEIRITMRRQNDSLVLTVSDNGVGLPADLDLKNPDSSGLELVKLLTGQIGGVLDLDKSRGTSFQITFPAP